MQKRIRDSVTSALMALLLISPVATAEHSLTDIATTALLEMQARAEAAHYRDVEVQVRPLDARLALGDCAEPLRVLPETTQRALGPVSVGIRCDAPKPWTLYVRGQVSASATVPVLTTSVARGEILSRSDIALESQRITRDIGPIVSEIADIIGKETRRSLSAGSLLKHADLRAPELVARGDHVMLVSSGSGLKVSMQGKALGGGTAGDRILVTNLSSGKRVEGVIARDGTVVMR